MKFKYLFFVIIMVLCINIPAYSQVSLDPSDYYTDIVVGDYTYTCLRDATEPTKFYYLPSTVRLAEYTPKGSKTKKPVFTLLKYQYPDPKNKSKLLEGAILQFAITMAPTGSDLKKMQKILFEKYKSRAKKWNKRIKDAKKAGKKTLKKPMPKCKASDIEITGVPIRKSRIQMFKQEGDLIAVAGAKDGIGPTSTTAKVPFFIKLNKLGAKVFQQLFTKGAGGWPINMEFQYEGLTAPAGFKVQVDWKKMYSHYSKNTRSIKKSCGFFWSRRKSEEKDYTTVRDKLIEEDAIKIQLTITEDFTMEEAKTYLEPIIQMANEKLLKVEAPKEVEPARAARPNAGGWWGSGEATSVAIKDVKKEKLGKQTFDMNITFYQKRTSLASGIIHLGQYGDEAYIKKNFIQTLDYGDFERATLALPAVSSRQTAGVTQVDIIVSIEAPEIQKKAQAKGEAFLVPPQQSISWYKEMKTQNGTVSEAWLDGEGDRRTSMVFPLQSLYDNAKKYFPNKFKEKMYYKTVYKITHNESNKPIEITKHVPMFDGDLPFTTPFSVISYVKILPIDIDSFYNKKSAPYDAGIEKFTVKINENEKRYSIKAKDAGKEYIYMIDNTKPLKVETELKSYKKLTAEEKAAFNKSKDRQKVTKVMSYKGNTEKETNMPSEVIVEVDEEDWADYYVDTYDEDNYAEGAKEFGNDDEETPDDAWGDDEEEDEDDDW